jgi:hypothetical protein
MINKEKEEEKMGRFGRTAGGARSGRHQLQPKWTAERKPELAEDQAT